MTLRVGTDAVQVGVEVAALKFGVLATDAVVQRGQSVLHSQAGRWIVGATMKPPEGADTIRLRRHAATYCLEYDEIIHPDASCAAAQVAAVRTALKPQLPTALA